MSGATSATLVGSIEEGLLLLAFFMNLFKLLRADSYPYILLNLAGGTLACLSSWMIDSRGSGLRYYAFDFQSVWTKPSSGLSTRS